VVFLGTNETWRWRFVRDGHYHRRFWANVIRYLATLDTQRVTITTGGDRFDVGSSVTVRAQAFDKQYRPLRAETIEIIYRRLGADQPGSVTLKAVEGKEGLYEGAFEPDRTGTYVLTAKVDDADADDAVAEKRIQVQVPQAEARRVEADHDVLKRVASPTGRFMPIWDIARLTEHPRLRIPEGRLRNVRERPYEIWDTPAMLIALLLLLTVEWVFRKLRNMA